MAGGRDGYSQDTAGGPSPRRLSSRMSGANGFPRIHGIFYSIFDPVKGSRPMIQVPDGVIRRSPTSEVPDPIVEFDEIKNYIIPKPPLCNHLVSILYKGYFVVGHPVIIVDEHYERNSFTFNLAFIFSAKTDTACYESVITRTAKMLKALEEQSHYLSNSDNIVALDSAIEQMFQDLNSFSECQIPIDDSNKIDIKLFPILEAPPEIHGFEVPSATMNISVLVDETWDRTLERLLPYINGVNSVRRIADLACADYELTKKGIQHLVHYGCVVILGVFQFSNTYAVTSNIADIRDPLVFQEFSDYVYRHNSSARSGSSVRRSRPNSQSLSSSPHEANMSISSSTTMLSVKQVFKLYTGFNSGTPLSSWYNTHRDLLQDIELIRFLSFGILKRLIYRVHCYPLWIAKRLPPSHETVERTLEANNIDRSGAEIILNAIETPQHFDYLCTELRASRVKVAKVLKSLGDWAVVNR